MQVAFLERDRETVALGSRLDDVGRSGGKNATSLRLPEYFQAFL